MLQWLLFVRPVGTRVSHNPCTAMRSETSSFAGTGCSKSAALPVAVTIDTGHKPLCPVSGALLWDLWFALHVLSGAIVFVSLFSMIDPALRTASYVLGGLAAFGDIVAYTVPGWALSIARLRVAARTRPGFPRLQHTVRLPITRLDPVPAALSVHG